MFNQNFLTFYSPEFKKHPPMLHSNSQPQLDLNLSPLPSPLLRKHQVYSAHSSRKNSMVTSGQVSPVSWSFTPNQARRNRPSFLANSPGTNTRKRIKVNQEPSKGQPERKISPSASPVQLHARLMQHVSAVSTLSEMCVSQLKPGELPFVPGLIPVVSQRLCLSKKTFLPVIEWSLHKYIMLDNVYRLHLESRPCWFAC